MRVGIIAIQHESNTFVETPTTLDDFRRVIFCSGEEMRRTYESAHHEVGGFFQGLADEKIDAIPIFAANAVPSGIITAECADALLKEMLDELTRHQNLDGLLVAPHGAAVAQNHHDFDGHWLSLLRATVGSKIPIVCTLDLHANVSPRMIDACHATIAYRTNPHLDQRERGIEAATLIAKTLRRQIKPTQAAAFPPIAINIERQLTADSPCKDLIAFADAQLQNKAGGASAAILSNSLVLGFPYADVAEMGSSFIAITDNNKALAQQYADDLAHYVIKNQNDFVAQLISVDEALSLAQKSQSPICLLDIGDNIGGGSPGDSTVLLHALHRGKIQNSFIALCDPRVAQLAFSSGINNLFSTDVGSPDFAGTFKVLSLHSGDFTETTPRHGGTKNYHMGPTAIVQSETVITIMLTTLRTPPFSLNQLKSCNLNPAKFQILVAKGVHAPVAAYREVCKTFIRVNTPGVTCADMTQQTYRHRRRPLFPFEPIAGE